MKESKYVTFDLLSFRPISALVLSPVFPVVFQVLTLAAVAILVYVGFGLGTDLSPAELKLFRKTNLATLVVWGLWWPAMIALALFFGRAWCTVCPMELVNRLGDAIARKVGWPRARMGRLLQTGWITLVLYLLMQILVAGVSIHRVPHFTAIMLLALFGLALLAGLFFHQPRSFCSGFCPASALLSVYSRFTPVQLSLKQTSVCESCKTKDCVRGQNRHRFDKRSCPSLLRPFAREPSDGCVLCLQCAKVCPYENIGLGIVDEDAPIRNKVLLRPFEAGFVMVALGFVAHEVIGEVQWLDSMFHFVPERLATLAPAVPFGWFEAGWFLVLFPVIVWALIAGFGRLMGHRGGLGTLLLAAATGAAPVVAVAHLAKAVAKISSWGAYLPGSLTDPGGIETLRRLSQGSAELPPTLMGLSVVGWIMLIFTALVAFRAWRWAQQMPAESKAAVLSGMLASMCLYTSVLAIWTLPVP